LLLPTGGALAARRRAALWQQPTLYGAAAVGVAIVAFPLTTILGSVIVGMALAGLAIALGIVGLVMYVASQLPSPLLGFIGLAAGIATLFGLIQDNKRAELIQRASSIDAERAELEKKHNEVEKLKKLADADMKTAEELRKDAKELSDKAEDAPLRAAQEKKKAQELRDQATQAEIKAKETLAKVTAESKEAEQKKAELEKLKDKVADEEKTAKKAKQDADVALEKLKKEKELVDSEKDKAKELLDKAEETQKKIGEAVKILMSRLKDPDPAKRSKAVQAIAQLDSNAPIEIAYAVCEATITTDEKFRKDALFAVQKVRPKIYFPVVGLPGDAKAMFMQEGINSEYFKLAMQLGELGKEAAATTPILANYLNTFLGLKVPTDADVETAKFLVTAFGKVTPADAAGVNLLGKFAAYKATPPKDGESGLRQEARERLFEIGKITAGLRKQIAPLLSAGLKEGRADYRKQVCEWLAAYGPDAKMAAAELMNLAKSDPDAAVKAAAEKALQQVQK
jgi:hypothetical protein